MTFASWMMNPTGSSAARGNGLLFSGGREFLKRSLICQLLQFTTTKTAGKAGHDQAAQSRESHRGRLGNGNI